MRILFVGNSYTHYNNMPQIVQKMADSKGSKVEVHMSAESNHTFKMHSKREALFKTIRKHKWDYVVLQGFSRELAFGNDYIDTAVVPYFSLILDSIYKNNPCTNVWLYQTWGYLNGYSDGKQSLSYQEMSDAIHRGYLYLGEKYNLPIVPVGKVWETVKENFMNYPIYSADGQHPALLGSYLVAYCFYYSILRDKSPLDYYSQTLSKLQCDEIQKIASSVISTNYNRYELWSNFIQVNKTSKKFSIDVIAVFPNASKVVWDYGDGITEIGLTSQHTYKKKGTYTVKATVYKSCGAQEIKRKVTF
ncbi:MAG: hypothetical protein EB023_08240 [Flavobacteriia bacterium]|nr:hypothetical protein [Flavobacteriia bacterium]